MPSLMDFLFGSQDKFKKLPNYNPAQMQNLNQLTGFTGQSGNAANDVLAYLQQFMNPESDVYKNFEAPYLRDFEHGIGKLAENFASGANGGALSSSGFAQALGGAQGDLQAKLAGLKSGLQAQAGQSILGQYNTNVNQSLGARPFDYVQQSGNAGFFPQLLGAGLGTFAGGGGLGSMLSGMLTNKLFNSQQGRFGGNIAPGASVRY